MAKRSESPVLPGEVLCLLWLNRALNPKAIPINRTKWEGKSPVIQVEWILIDPMFAGFRKVDPEVLLPDPVEVLPEIVLLGHG
jgi:hypothetical protein